MTTSEEQIRRRYLQAMDIPLYLSRVDCPGALPTVRVPLPDTLSSPAPETLTDATASSPAIEGSAGVQPARDPSLSATATATARARVTAKSATEPGKVAAEKPMKTGAVRFSLVLFRAGRWLWLEETPDGMLASDQVQLVAAMANALVTAAARDTAKPVTSQFKWPPHNNAQFDLGEEAARAGLEAFLQRHVGESGCSGLIVLGEGAGLRLGDASLSVPVVARTLATRDMITQPGLKRQVWSDLKLLVDAG